MIPTGWQNSAPDTGCSAKLAMLENGDVWARSASTTTENQCDEFDNDQYVLRML